MLNPAATPILRYHFVEHWGVSTIADQLGLHHTTVDRVLRTLPGEQGKVDWAHIGHVQIGQAKRALMAFVMVLSCGGVAA